VWNVKDDLTEEDYTEGVEYRNVDLRNDVLQVFANANKVKQLKKRTWCIKGGERRTLRSRQELGDWK